MILYDFVLLQYLPKGKDKEYLRFYDNILNMREIFSTNFS